MSSTSPSAFANARVGLIYDNRTRPETTGEYVKRAMAGLCRVAHFHPGELDEIPHEAFDLFVHVDDGLRYVLPPRLRPAAWWCIDTHLQYDWDVYKAAQFDWVFTAQRDGAEMMRRDGVDRVWWLPLGCDPEIHGKHDLPKQHDVCFVGNLFPGPRMELVQLLAARFTNTLVTRAYFTEMARLFSQARIVFNRSIRNDINMRVFEALCAGSLLVTNDLSENGLDALFRDGEHLATYRSADDLVERVAYYLAHDDEREAIAASGRAEALRAHTYGHRAETILRTCLGGEMPPRETLGVTSIVLAARGGPFTDLAVDAVERTAREPYELIVERGHEDVVDAWRAGLVRARGDQVCLLDDGVMVVGEWLSRAVGRLRLEPQIALVAPLSSEELGGQVPIGSPAEAERVAQQLAVTQGGLAMPAARLRPTAPIVRRAALDALGPLEGETAETAVEAWRRRAAAMGRTCVVATDAFVHRFAPPGTTRAGPIDRAADEVDGQTPTITRPPARRSTGPREEALRLFEAGREALGAGDLELAGTRLREAAAQAPELAAAHYLLGCALLQRGQAELSLPSFELAARLEPGRADFLNGVGAALQESGRAGEARQWYERALRVDPGNQAARENLAALGLPNQQEGPPVH